MKNVTVTSLYNDLRMYGMFVGQIELDVNIHQKFFTMDGITYSVTMKGGQALCICKVTDVKYNLGAMSERRGEI